MSDRFYGRLTAPSATKLLRQDSILCLPIGSYEQHGPHLPIYTDAVIAEGFTNRLVSRYGRAYDLWALPMLPYGLSLEHAWSSGTISLTSKVFIDILTAVVGEYVRSTPSRNLVIINGHGGNRGVLEAALYELTREHGVNVCVMHPTALSKVKLQSSLPEIHAGMRETSVMLALAPNDVHLDRLPSEYVEDSAQREAISRLVLDRGVTWPWTSNDDSVSSIGIMGSDPRGATVEQGELVLESALDSCQEVLDTLLTRRT